MGIEVGRLVTKLAGRDAGKQGLVVKIIDDTYVEIAGNVRRKRCNIKHLLVHGKVAKIKSGASDVDVKKGLESVGIPLEKKGEKREKKGEPLKKKRKVGTPKAEKKKKAPAKKEKHKKEEKKVEKKEENPKKEKVEKEKPAK